MRKHFFWLRYPDPSSIHHSTRAMEFSEGPKEDRIELAIEGAPIPERPLSAYLQDRGLLKFRKKLHIIRVSDRVPLHSWYIPQSGDVIQCTAVIRGGDE